jgi:hypothetical protein
MKEANVVTNTHGFWNSLGPIARRVVALMLCFIGLPLAIVINKLGFHGLAMLTLLLVGSLFFWASGFWYLLRAILRNLWLALLLDR